MHIVTVDDQNDFFFGSASRIVWEEGTWENWDGLTISYYPKNWQRFFRDSARILNFSQLAKKKLNTNSVTFIQKPLQTLNFFLLENYHHVCGHSFKFILLVTTSITILLKKCPFFIFWQKIA